MLYTILNFRRLELGPKEFVIMLERAVIDYLESFGILHGRRDFPGCMLKIRKWPLGLDIEWIQLPRLIGQCRYGFRTFRGDRSMRY